MEFILKQSIVDELENKTIKVIEEQLIVDKSIVTTGSLHVKKRVEETVQPIVMSLAKEAYDVKRVPKNELVEKAPDAIRNEGDRIIISVVEERVVVEKKLFLVEEIHLIKDKQTSEYRDQVTLKKEVVDVERKAAPK
jgi:uncharacterized protein (TIGR02271 family)